MQCAKECSCLTDLKTVVIIVARRCYSANDHCICLTALRTNAQKKRINKRNRLLDLNLAILRASKYYAQSSEILSPQQ